MPSQLQLLQQATMRLDVKASIWLSRLRVVPKFVPILDIRNMVSPATRKLIDDPPPQSSWMPGAAIIELNPVQTQTRRNSSWGLRESLGRSRL